MEDVYTDESREARRLLATVVETMPADPATVGDALLRGMRSRYTRRRRARALVSAGAAAAAAGTAAAVLLPVSGGAPPALAAVTSALSRASTESFRVNLEISQPKSGPGDPPMRSPLYMTGELDLKRNLAEETFSNGWRTLIVGKEAYTELPPAQTRRYETGGKPWTEEPVSDNLPPVASGGAQLAWDFNSDRPFNPQALLDVLRSGAKVRDEGPVSGPGWTGTRYRFWLAHPDGTEDLVESVTCVVDVDSQGHIRSIAQTTVWAGPATGTINTLDFTFSDFGVRFSVMPPPASQVDSGEGLGVQF